MTSPPYAEIIAAADRRWTLRLVDRLAAPDLPDEEVDDLVGALQAVSDPRSFAPLGVILLDAARHERIRRAAGTVWHVAPVPACDTLRTWWLGSDEILRHHALLSMGYSHCPDIVLALAADPAHPWQADALGRMGIGFDVPQHQAIKLSADRPAVRAARGHLGAAPGDPACRA